jgi:hypothetical protein
MLCCMNMYHTYIVYSSPIQLKGKESSLVCWNFVYQCFDVFSLLFLRFCYLFFLLLFLLLFVTIICNTSSVLKF